jgi:hypothetical protein
MKWLIVTVLILAQQPAKAPEGKGAAEGDNANSARSAEPAKADSGASTQAAPASSQPTAGMECDEVATASNKAATANNQHTSDEDRASQWKIVWFTGVLAGVGVLQLTVMFLQWCIYKRQAREMRKQRFVMTGQKHLMWRQWKVMQSQIAQMISAGEQTERLIGQTTTSANAALSNAITAKQAVEIVISKERCRISLRPHSLGIRFLYPIGQHPIIDQYQVVSVRADVFGLTEGHILDGKARSCVAESPGPPALTLEGFDSQGLPSRVLFVAGDSESSGFTMWAGMAPNIETTEEVRDILEGRKFIHCWGYVKYRDAFFDVERKDRITSFRVVWKFTDDRRDSNVKTPFGERYGKWVKYGSPEDNQET